MLPLDHTPGQPEARMVAGKLRHRFTGSGIAQICISQQPVPDIVPAESHRVCGTSLPATVRSRVIDNLIRTDVVDERAQHSQGKVNRATNIYGYPMTPGTSAHSILPMGTMACSVPACSTVACSVSSRDTFADALGKERNDCTMRSDKIKCPVARRLIAVESECPVQGFL